MKKIIKGSKQSILSSIDNLLETEDNIVTINTSRNLKMNDCFHGWCRFIANETGNDFETVKSHFLILNGHYKEYKPNINSKKRIKVATSSADINKEDFLMILNSMEIWCAEQGIMLPVSEHNEIKINF